MAVGTHIDELTAAGEHSDRVIDGRYHLENTPQGMRYPGLLPAMYSQDPLDDAQHSVDGGASAAAETYDEDGGGEIESKSAAGEQDDSDGDGDDYDEDEEADAFDDAHSVDLAAPILPQGYSYKPVFRTVFSNASFTPVATEPKEYYFTCKGFGDFRSSTITSAAPVGVADCCFCG